jgi:hypothetical protein
MSWRYLQLEQKTCLQDQVVLDLFKNKVVKYIGRDVEFAAMLNTNPDSRHVVAVLNSSMWLSEMIDAVRGLLEPEKFKTFYIGVNRYQILGNDTTLTFDQQIASGATIINLLTNIAQKQEYAVLKSGYFDNDQGRYMNYVQPLTWIYGTSTSNI